MNIKLLLALALVIGMGFTMRDTIGTGFSLLTGRTAQIDNGAGFPQNDPRKIEDPSPEGELSIWEIESNRRIKLWRDCTYTTYREENQDECDRLYESVDR